MNLNTPSPPTGRPRPRLRRAAIVLALGMMAVVPTACGRGIDDAGAAAPAAKLKRTPSPPLPAASRTLPGRPQLNSAGNAVTLDETALLACAHSQFAWVALQDGDPERATSELASAALRAEASSVSEVAGRAAALGKAGAGPGLEAQLTNFLDLCRRRGWES